MGEPQKGTIQQAGWFHDCRGWTIMVISRTLLLGTNPAISLK